MSKTKIYEPKIVIIVMKAIQEEVVAAIRSANIDSIKLVEVVSFPGESEKNRIDGIEMTTKAIEKGIKLGIINGI